MAVRKMEKVTAIAPLNRQNRLLSCVQSLQSFEVISLGDSRSNSEIIYQYFQKKANSNKFIEYERKLLEVTEALSFLEEHSKAPGMLSKLKTKRQKITLKELESLITSGEYLDEVKKAKELRKREEELLRMREELKYKEEELNRWKSFKAKMDEIERLTLTGCLLGTVAGAQHGSFVREINGIKPIVATNHYETKDRVYYSIFYLKKNKERVGCILNKYIFEKVDFDFPGTPLEEYENIKKQIEELVQEEKDLRKEFKGSVDSINLLQRSEEALLALIEQEKVKEYILASDHLFIIQGWLPVEEKEAFMEVLREALEPNTCICEFTEPNIDEYGDIPIDLKNNKVVKPFETLTETYSLPKYDEVDPTPFMTPFYLVFFGMMVADVGYGLVLLLAILFIKLKLNPGKKLEKNIDLFFYLSFPTITWGFIYGSIFGVALPYEPLLSTSKDITMILFLSVAFGFVQICTGLLIKGVQKIKNKEYLAGIEEGFAWQGILIGAALAMAGMMLLANNIVFYLGIALAVLGALLVVLLPAVQGRNKVKGVFKGAYNLYGVTSYAGDLVSYTRLMALGISGGSIATAFNMLITFMPGPLKWTLGVVLIILLHALNIFLSYLGAYVHGMRLQYVEFFGKFYEGAGRKFAPLKIKEKYFDLKRKEK